MFRFLRKHRSVLMVSLAACIAGLLLFGVGGSSFVSSPQDTAVKVNGSKITQFEYDRLYNQILRQRKDITAEERKKVGQEVLNEVIRQEVMYQEAQRYGIFVTDKELQLYLANIPAFQREGQFDPRLYAQTVAQVIGMSPRQFEAAQKKEIAGRKLNKLIASAIHIPQEQYDEAFEMIVKLEKDAQKKKEIQENRTAIEQQIRNQEVNLVFSDWLGQLNTQLKVEIVSDNLQKRLTGNL